jgi:hypothetical protein
VDGFWGVVLDWVGFLVLVGYYALGIVVGVLCFQNFVLNGFYNLDEVHYLDVTCVLDGVYVLNEMCILIGIGGVCGLGRKCVL